MIEAKALIAQRLRLARGPRGQVPFADRLGVAQQTWSKYESGDIPDSWLVLSRLRDEESVDLNQLLTSREDAA